jgi:hypothetical protein
MRPMMWSGEGWLILGELYRLPENRAHLFWGRSARISEIHLVMFASGDVPMLLKKFVNLLDGWPLSCEGANMYDLGR